MPFFVKSRITYCLTLTLRELENVLSHFFFTFDDFVGWTAHQTVFSVACNSDSEMLAALQTKETVVRTQRHRLDGDKFPTLSVG